MNDVLIELQNLRKEYTGTVAVKDVSFSVQKGHIHALVGENGAGKSTLIKMISGAVQPSAGSILFEGKPCVNQSPLSAIERGIGVIYQEFNLVPEMTVAENVFLGRTFNSRFFTESKTAVDRTQALLEEWNLELDPSSPVSALSIAQQQIVEIIKAVSHNVKLLVMDEPTATLTLDEVDILYRVTRDLAARGVTIIYISHRLEEIFDLCDRVTVMRDGSLVQTLDIGETDQDGLIRLMVGREIGQFPSKKPPTDEVLMSVKGLSDGIKFTDISFDLKKGEILGVYALIGAGRTETALTIYGERKKAAGSVSLNGKQVEISDPADAYNKGIGLVPEDRKGQGLVMSMISSQNITLSIIKRLTRRGLINRKKESETVDFYCDKLKLQSHVPSEESQNLSGGTQQKVVLAKVLAGDVDVILFDEPTRGIDVGAKHEIYELMNTLCSEGKGILMISSEMPELLGMSDRIIVMREGRISAEFSREEATQEKLLNAAAKS